MSEWETYLPYLPCGASRMNSVGYPFYQRPEVGASRFSRFHVLPSLTRPMTVSESKQITKKSRICIGEPQVQ